MRSCQPAEPLPDFQGNNNAKLADPGRCTCIGWSTTGHRLPRHIWCACPRRHPHHSAARSRRATPATPHTSAWKHMPMTVLRGAPGQATGSVYRSSGHPVREHSLMWARWLCGSGSALMGASTHSSYSLARTHHLSRMHAPSSRPLSSIPSMHDPLSPPPFAGRRTLTT